LTLLALALVAAACTTAPTTQLLDRARDEYRAVQESPMAASYVAEAGYAGLVMGKRLVIPGLSNKASFLLSHIIPRSWSMPLIAWLQDKRQA
jgi:short-subunit dehydrogenase